MLFSGLIWFLLMLLPLVILQRLLHREIQAVLLISTRSPQLVIGLFAILFFPGIFVHELSHFLMAKLLRVRTGKISLVPATLPNGRLQMGYVETEKADLLRDSLIGLAPLIAGSLFIAYAGLNRLGLNSLLNMLSANQTDLFWIGLRALPQANDFYLWFYLVLVVSSTMMPSESDRHAWLPLAVWMIALLALAIFSGAGTWMLQNIAPSVDNFLYSVALLFGLSNIIHIALLLPFFLFHRLLTAITKVDIR
jgi:hypothetical protein